MWWGIDMELDDFQVSFPGTGLNASCIAFVRDVTELEIQVSTYTSGREAKCGRPFFSVLKQDPSLYHY